jgi:hypothetical protein
MLEECVRDHRHERMTIQYRVFMSYSRCDTAWAKWLHKAFNRPGGNVTGVTWLGGPDRDGGPGVDSAPMRAWTYIMLVPPGKEEHRAASYTKTRRP